MSTTPPEFPLLRVLLINLLVHGMTPPLLVHVPPFIHACITLFFQLQIQNHFKTFQEHQEPQEPSRTMLDTCLIARSLDPFTNHG